MRIIITFLTAYNLLFAPDKIKEQDKTYATTHSSFYSVNGKKYIVENIRVRDGIIDANYYGEPINGETIKGEITFKFYKNPKEGTKTYLIDNTPFLKNDNYIAVRYDFMVGSKVPSPSVVSKKIKGQTVTVSKRNGKLSITSNGIIMDDDSKLIFNIVQL